MKPFPAIVEWLDAVTYEGRQSGTITHAPYQIRTVGWCMKHDEVGITLCTDLDQTSHDWWREERFIPAGMIVSVTPLKKKG